MTKVLWFCVSALKMNRKNKQTDWITELFIIQWRFQLSNSNCLNSIHESLFLFFCCFLYFLGGRINSRDVWMYNSQLNLWIRVACLNKGRWRHKMGVLLGKVRRVLCLVTSDLFQHEVLAPHQHHKLVFFIQFVVKCHFDGSTRENHSFKRSSVI